MPTIAPIIAVQTIARPKLSKNGLSKSQSH